VPRRPFGIQALAVLLSCYAMGGFFLVIRVVGDRDPRVRWPWLVTASLAFAVSAGFAGLSVWRLERRAPAAVTACGVLGLALCLTIPASAPAEAVTRDTWRAAALGGVLFAAFLLVAAWYVRQRVAPRA